MKQKICVISSSRADFGHLQWVMQHLKRDPRYYLQIVATGSHLAKAHGMTYREIEAAGFSITARLSILSDGDTIAHITKSAGKAMIGFSKIFSKLKPDLLLVVGDRYEIHSAVTAALLAKIPVAHIAGGDVTEGAFDDALRHSISKMSHLHFVTNLISAKRVRQMGENPRYIFNVGNPALDHISRLKLLTRKEIEKALSFKLRPKNFLITFHPVTLSHQSSESQFKELLRALEKLGPNVGLIFTKPNADPEGQSIAKLMESFVRRHPSAIARSSLGHLLYLSVMNEVNLVLGNSSSGIYEAPSFKIPTVNIGDRQKGRLRAKSVIDCAPKAASISRAIRAALTKNCSKVSNPYGQGNSSEQIYKVISSIKGLKALIQKKFCNLQISTQLQPVYIIAEAGVNHNGSLRLAKKLVDAAAIAGADAVKFQTFNTDAIVTRSAKKAHYQQITTGVRESQYEMLKKLELSQKNHFELNNYCRKKKIGFLSTPFDLLSLDFLIHDLKVKKIKISSGDITNGPLLVRAARSGLPIILSTGMSTLEEVRQAVKLIAENYPSKPIDFLKSNLTLLHCTTEYPAPFSDVNLLAMDYLRDYFDLSIGLSDHSLGIAIPVAAVGRGASVIEKHLTLDQKMEGPDHRASLIPTEFKAMVKAIREVEQALGLYEKKPTDSELKNREPARKSIVAAKPIREGELFTEQNLTLKRPGTGLSPMNFWSLTGKKSRKNYEKDQVISL